MTDIEETIRNYSIRVSQQMRVFGIEMTPEEAKEMALETIKDAVRVHLRDALLDIMKKGRQS